MHFYRVYRRAFIFNDSFFVEFQVDLFLAVSIFKTLVILEREIFVRNKSYLKLSQRYRRLISLDIQALYDLCIFNFFGGSSLPVKNLETILPNNKSIIS